MMLIRYSEKVSEMTRSRITQRIRDEVYFATEQTSARKLPPHPFGLSTLGRVTGMFVPHRKQAFVLVLIPGTRRYAAQFHRLPLL